MVRLEGGADPVAMLATVGSEFYEVHGDDIPPGRLAEVLPEGEREVRAEAVLTPPAEGEAGEGMGAWHVNARDEMHLVRSGEGVLQVITPDGVVTVWLGPGTVMVMRGAEHRYRPLSEQSWVLRWSGPPDADLDARETGRADGPWPQD